jgi:hypothetical protein
LLLKKNERLISVSILILFFFKVFNLLPESLDFSVGFLNNLLHLVDSLMRFFELMEQLDVVLFLLRRLMRMLHINILKSVNVPLFVFKFLLHDLVFAFELFKLP